MQRWAASCFALVIVLASVVVVTPQERVFAQAAGNAYVSGTFGFEVGWDDRIWYVIGQGTDDGWEELTLADGSGFIFFTAGEGYDGDAQSCLDDVVSSMVGSRGVDDLQPLVDDDGDPIEGGDDQRAFASYTYRYDLGGSTTREFARYVECQTMIDGESVFIADVISPLDEYETELTLARDVIDEVTLPSPGESAPVFLSDGWRFAVAGAERGTTINAVGLEPRGDDEWVVVVVDATNLQPDRDELSVRDFRLQADDDTFRIAPSSTESAADELGTAPASADRGVSLRSGQTRRLTLAFLVPSEATDVSLQRAESVVPLNVLLDERNGLDALRSPVPPPFQREALVDQVSASGLISITYTSDDDDAVVELIGIESLTEDDCHGPAFRAVLDGLVGKTITFEREPNQVGRNPISGYIWIVNDDGVPVQLNQQLLAAGDAPLTDDVASTRFGAWLTTISQEAENANLGFWGECA